MIYNTSVAEHNNLTLNGRQYNIPKRGVAVEIKEITDEYVTLLYADGSLVRCGVTPTRAGRVED